MIKRIFIIWPILVALLSGLPLSAMSDSKGTEFIFAFQNNYSGATDLLLYVTSEQNTQGVVEVPGIGFSEEFTVTAGTVTTLELPDEVKNLPANGQASLGIHVVADEEVTIYGLNLQRYTSDAFLALPVDALDVEYMATSYDGLAQFASLNLSSQIAIVSTADNTLVEIIPAADVGDRLAGEPFTVTLDRLEVYQLSSNIADLTGTLISSGSPVAVMGGHKCADTPSLSRSPTGGRIGWCDHLVEMMPPVSTWGQSFSIIPLATRLNGSVVRLLARENDTRVSFNGTQNITLNAGEIYETINNEFLEIFASAPVMVTQYSPGQALDSVPADPFMMLIPPNEQFLSSYTFTTPASGFASNFVNIIVPTIAIDSLLLDGVPIDPGLFTVIGSSGLSGIQFPLSLGSHRVTADQPFGIYVYGFNAYDSYGYPGGMATVELNPSRDSFAPNIGSLSHVGRTFLGTASDSEDINVNGILDPGEDLNGNGILDRRSEDTNGNGVLDAGEDVNNNGVLDRDRGIYKIELLPGSSNLTLDIQQFASGVSPAVHFRLDLIDPAVDGMGVLRVNDLNGNVADVDVLLPSTAALGDVHLITTVSGDRVALDYYSFSHTPSALDEQVDKTVVEWRFESLLADQIEDIAFDVILQDPQPGEQRLVTQSVQLSYINAPGGERITRDLGPQSVWVSNSVFDVSASSDKTNYGPNELAQFTVVVNNIGTTANQGSVEFIVEDINGVVVESFSPFVFDPVPAGGSATLNQNWNTNNFIAGTYQLHVVIRDLDSTITNEAFVPFSVVSSTIGLAQASIGIIVGVNNSGVFVQKDQYNTTDVVQVQSSLTNLTENTRLTNTVLKVTVLNPMGQNIFSDEMVIDTELVPDAIRDVINSIMLDDVVAGTYQVQVILIDPETSAIIAAENSSFIVAQNIALSVEGQVEVAFNELLLGDTQICTDTLTSRVSQPLVDLEIQTKLVNIEAQQELDTQNALITVLPDTPFVQNRSVDTRGLAGDYACVLLLNAGTGLQTLDFAWFNVFNLIAVPGNDITAFVGQQVILDGTSSREAAGLPLSYQWRFVSKPVTSNTQFADASSGSPSFFVDEQGEYVIELVVNNGTEDSLPKQLVVTVPNRLPVANAGPDQLVTVGEMITLDGTGSNDLDGDLLAFNWRLLQQPAGSSGELLAADIANPNITIDVAGVYRVELIVYDGFDASVADTVLLNVGNVPPVANAGSDIAALLGDTITLDGSASSDVNGDDLNYRWFFEGLPQGSNANLFNNASVRPSFITDEAGDYIVRLTVNDGLADSEPDFVTVSVGNSAPVANAGQDQPGNVGDLITLDSSASHDLDGDPLTYRWSIVNKPSGSNAQLSNIFAANPSLYLDIQGDYISQLIVNDGTIDSAPDTVFITADNLRPIASAYYDGIGDLYTGDQVTLNGFDSYDPDSDPISYQWSWVERPPGSTAALEAADTPAPFFIVDQPGNYVAQLVVSDSELSSAPVTVLILGAQACVEDLAIRPKRDKLQLTWTDNPDTEFVEIERSTSMNGPFEVIAQTESTYATYLDANLAFGPTYYYRIRGSFSSSQVMECSYGGGYGDEELFCGNLVCFYGEAGFRCQDVETEDYYRCERLSETSVICGGETAGRNSCPPGDNFCEEVCADYQQEVDWGLEGFPEFNFDLCQAPAQQCQSQIIASTPVGRVRTTRVPDVIGMSIEQAQTTLEQSRLILGEVRFERTTVVPAGEVIKQDMPKDSVMPRNTAIDIFISTRGVPE